MEHFLLSPLALKKEALVYMVRHTARVRLKDMTFMFVKVNQQLSIKYFPLLALHIAIGFYWNSFVFSRVMACCVNSTGANHLRRPNRCCSTIYINLEIFLSHKYKLLRMSLLGILLLITKLLDLQYLNMKVFYIYQVCFAF